MFIYFAQLKQLNHLRKWQLLCMCSDNLYVFSVWSLLEVKVLALGLRSAIKSNSKSEKFQKNWKRWYNMNLLWHKIENPNLTYIKKDNLLPLLLQYFSFPFQLRLLSNVIWNFVVSNSPCVGWILCLARSMSCQLCQENFHSFFIFISFSMRLHNSTPKPCKHYKCRTSYVAMSFNAFSDDFIWNH